MSMSKQLVFFGTEDFSAKSLEMLISDGWQILAVITKPDTRSGRGQKQTQPKVKVLAKKHNIEVFQPNNLSDIELKIRNLRPDIGVLVAYGKIIPQSIIDIFPLGIINVHPSLLPKFRGPAPVEAAILSGDKQTAISLMKLTAGMDEGPVYLQHTVDLDGTENRLSLGQTLSNLGAKLLADNLNEIIDGSIKATPQDDSKATYTKLLSKDDGITNWQEPAEVIQKKVRAYLGFPKLRAKVFGHLVIIVKARLASTHNDGLLVMACDPGYLELLEVIAPSGRTMSGADFIRGYKN